MMSQFEIPELAFLSPVRAAGILSRLILDIESNGLNPASKPRDADEYGLRKKIIDHAEQYIAENYKQVSEDDWRKFLIELLEAEADSRSEPVDEKAAIDRLVEAGEIPSDLLNVKFATEYLISKHNNDFDDSALIPTAVKSNDMKQEVIRFNDLAITGVGVYGKYFNFGSDADKFLLCVFGWRVGLDFNVSYSVRIYVNDVNLFGARSIMEALQRFVGKYGLSLNLEEWSGQFLEIKTVNPKMARPESLLNSFQYQIVFGSTGKSSIVELSKIHAVANRTVVYCMSGLEGDVYFVSYLFGVNYDKYKTDVKRRMRRERLVFDNRAEGLVSKMI